MAIRIQTAGGSTIELDENVDARTLASFIAGIEQRPSAYFDPGAAPDGEIKLAPSSVDDLPADRHILGLLEASRPVWACGGQSFIPHLDQIVEQWKLEWIAVARREKRLLNDLLITERPFGGGRVTLGEPDIRGHVRMYYRRVPIIALDISVPDGVWSRAWALGECGLLDIREIGPMTGA
jgi:hypothetical protein